MPVDQFAAPKRAAAGGGGCMRGPDNSASALRTLGLTIPVVALLSLPTFANPLRISGVDYLGDLPTLVAERNGYFAQNGVDVDVAYAESGRDNLQSLRSGEIDFALMAMTPLVFDALRDTTPGGPDDPVILANLSHARPKIHLMILDTGGTAAGAALSGRRVGVPRESNADYVLSVIAKIEGVAEDAFTVVDMAPADMGDALADGRVSAVSTWEPWARQLRGRFGDRLTDVADLGRYVSRWMLVTRRETVDTQPEQVVAVLRTYRDAVDWVQANEDAALATFDARYPGDHSGGVAMELLYDVTLEWSLVTSYRQQMAWARGRTGMADAELPSFMDIVAPAPLASIAPEAVLIPHDPRGSDGYGR